MELENGTDVSSLSSPFSLQNKVRVEFVPTWPKEKVSLDFVCKMYIKLQSLSLYLIACKRQCCYYSDQRSQGVVPMNEF